MATITASLVSSSDSVEKFRQEFNTLRSDVSNIQSGSLTITNEANNRILTSVSTNTFNAEESLTFDGTTFSVGGAMTVSGLTTLNGNLVIPNAGNIGSDGDNDAIAIASDGVVTMNQIPVFSAGINVSGGSIAGTLSTAAQTNITSVGTLTGLTVNGAVVINENSADVDFRVESNNNENMLFVDASADRVGIGTNAPGSALHISASSPRISLTDTDTSADHRINADSSAGNLAFDIDVNSETTSPSAVWNLKGTERMRLTTAGRLGIGTSSPSGPLDVRADSNSSARITTLGKAVVECGSVGDHLSLSHIGSSLNTTTASTYMALGFGASLGSFTRMGYFGYASTSGTTWSWVNEIDGAETRIYTQDSGGSGVHHVRFAQGETNFNEDGLNLDFRVESDNNANMLFVDAGNDRVVVGSNSGSGLLTVTKSQNALTYVDVSNTSTTAGTDGAIARLITSNNAGSGTTSADIVKRKNGQFGLINNETDSGAIFYHTLASTEMMRHTATETNFNDGSADVDFRVESNGNTHMLFVDGGNDNVHIGSSAVTSQSVPLQVGTGQANQIVVKGSGSGYTQGGIIIEGGTDNTPGNRAQGIYYFNEGNDRTYYSGTLYNNGTVWGVGTTTGTSLAVAAADNSNAVFTVNSSGDVAIDGALSKGSGSFRIDHPLPAKSDTHHLVHSFVEGPQADLIYRGRVDLVDGSATVNVDTAAGMTDGTFVVLCTDVQCFTSNESGWTAVKGSVSGNTLTITAQDNACTDTISWMVVGERKDSHMVATDWTDDNGKVIVEPLKPVI